MDENLNAIIRIESIGKKLFRWIIEGKTRLYVLLNIAKWIESDYSVQSHRF